MLSSRWWLDRPTGGNRCLMRSLGGTGGRGSPSAMWCDKCGIVLIRMYRALNVSLQASTWTRTICEFGDGVSSGMATSDQLFICASNPDTFSMARGARICERSPSRISMGITANTTFVMEAKDPGVLLPELLPFIMQTESFHRHSIKQSKGSVNPYVNFSDLPGTSSPFRRQKSRGGLRICSTLAGQRWSACWERSRSLRLCTAQLGQKSLRVRDPLELIQSTGHHPVGNAHRFANLSWNPRRSAMGSCKLGTTMKAVYPRLRSRISGGTLRVASTGPPSRLRRVTREVGCNPATSSFPSKPPLVRLRSSLTGSLATSAEISRG